MTFKKGQSPNPKGRPKGSRNKSTQELANRVKTLLENNYKLIEDDIKNIEPNERINAFAKLLGYVIPKQATISVEAKIEKEYTELERLLQDAPNEAVEAIAQKVLELQKLNNKEDG